MGFIKKKKILTDLWYLREWMQRDRYHAGPCVQKKSKQKKTKGKKKNPGCVEIQILSMARGNEGLSAFVVASPSWLAWSPWQITSAWPRHRQPPNPGRVALKGLNVKPLRSAHHIASAAAQPGSRSHPRQETHGQTRDAGESEATKGDEDQTQATLFVLFDRGFVRRRRRRRTQWVICSTHHMSLPFVSQVLMLNQTTQHTAESAILAA